MCDKYSIDRVSWWREKSYLGKAEGSMGLTLAFSRVVKDSPLGPG